VLDDPDDRVVKVLPPAAITGELRFVLVPSPISPLEFDPQQYATPVVVSPHMWT